MYPTLTLVALTLMIGGNLTAAQAGHESAFQDRNIGTLRSEVGSTAKGTANNYLPPIVQGTGATGNQDSRGRLRVPQQSGTTIQNSSHFTQRPSLVQSILNESQSTRPRVFPSRAPIYNVPDYQTDGRYPGSSRQQNRDSDYVPIPKDVIPLRDPQFQRQAVEKRKSKIGENNQFAPRPSSDLFSLRLHEYRRQSSTPPIARQDMKEPSRRIIQLQSEPGKTVSKQRFEKSEPVQSTERVNEKKVVSQALEPTVQPFPLKPEASAPVRESLSSQWIPPQVVEPKPQDLELKVVASEKTPDPLSKIKVVDEENQWVQPEVQFHQAETPEPKQEVVRTSPFKEPASIEPLAEQNPAVPSTEFSTEFSHEFSTEFATEFAKTPEPKQEVVQTSPFKEPTSIEPIAKPAKPSTEFSQLRSFEPFKEPFETKSKSAFPLQPKTQVDKRVVGNEFSPKPALKQNFDKAKQKFDNSFSPPLPAKDFAGSANSLGSKKKPPIVLKSPPKLPVETLKTPQFPTRAAAKFDLQASESAGLWWLYLLPIIPLLLIGWFLLRGSSRGTTEQEYQRPIPPRETGRQEFSGIEVEPKETIVPAWSSKEAETTSFEAEAQPTVRPEAVPFPIFSERETAPVPPEAEVSSTLEILREEDIEVLDDFDDFEDCELVLEADQACCNSEKQAQSCDAICDYEDETRESDANFTVENERSQDLVLFSEPEDSRSVEASKPLPTTSEIALVKTSSPRTNNLIQTNVEPGESEKRSDKNRKVESQSQSQSVSESTSSGRSAESDDLTKIRGIDQAVASLLRDNGIGSFEKLSSSGPQRLRQILSSDDSRFQFINPTQWPEQAELAAKKDWKGLKRWQTYHKEFPAAKVDQDTGLASGSIRQTVAVDLTKIHGIGPEVENVLQTHGINSFGKLAQSNPGTLKQILKSGGAKFQFINPTQWPEQAALAAKGDWNGLIRWQAKHKDLPSSKSNEATPEKNLNRQTNQHKAKRQVATAVKSSASEKDDLTSINGIGAATQRFLNKQGIFSFAQVAALDNEQLKDLFADRGNKFQLLNYETWAEQAKRVLGSTVQQTQAKKEAEPKSQSQRSGGNIVSLPTTDLNPVDQQFSR